jgi:glycosyltransferase involved in cell wall biosynthesis
MPSPLKRILLVSHANDNRDAGSSRVVHLISESISSGDVKVIMKHNAMKPKDLSTKILGRLILPKLMSDLVENAESYDVIVGFNGTLFPLFAKLKKRSQRPLLIDYVHGLSTFDDIVTLSEAEVGRNKFRWHHRLITGPLTRRLPRTWELRGACLADVVIVQNSRDREFLQRNGIANVLQVALPVLPEIAEASKRVSVSGRNSKKLLWFGSWTDRKGVNYLADALSAILQSVPDAVLTIGGTDRAEEEILAKFPTCTHRGIRVLKRISVQQQIKEYESNAIFLFPSLSEGFGFALLEAMSMGMAPVCTLTGFAADYATPEKDIVAVPMANSERLAAAVIRLMRDDAKRIEVASAAQKLVAQFTLERYGQNLMHIIALAERYKQLHMPSDRTKKLGLRLLEKTN